MPEAASCRLPQRRRVADLERLSLQDTSAQQVPVAARRTIFRSNAPTNQATGLKARIFARSYWENSHTFFPRDMAHGPQRQEPKREKIAAKPDKGHRRHVRSATNQAPAQKNAGRYDGSAIRANLMSSGEADC